MGQNLIFGGYARRTNTKCLREDVLWHQILLHRLHPRRKPHREERLLQLLSLRPRQKCLKRLLQNQCVKMLAENPMKLLKHQGE